MTVDELREVLKEFQRSERQDVGKDIFDPDKILERISSREEISYSSRIEDIEAYKTETENKIKELKDLVDDYNESLKDLSKINKNELNNKVQNIKNKETEIRQRQTNIRKSEAATTKHWAEVSKKVSTMATIINEGINMAFVALNANLDRQKVRMEAANELAMREIKVYGNTLTGLSKMSAGNITRSTKDNAYAAIDTVWESGKQQQIKQLEDRYTKEQLRTNISKINIQETSALIKGGMVIAGAAIGAAVGSVVPGIGTAVGAIVGAAVGVVTNIIDKLSGLSIKKQELALEQQKLLTEQAKQHLEMFNTIAKPLLDIGKKVNDVFLDNQDIAYKHGRGYGFSGKNVDNYARSVMSLNKTISPLGLDVNDYYKMQESYNENNFGRNTILSDKDALLVGTLGKQLNMEPSEISAITGVMSQFNLSVSDGSEMIYDMSNRVSKMGLNATKFGKDLVKNLKLAEKYQFKGGTRGVMEMAMWAQKMRVEMSSFMASSEKLRTGNIEDVIQTSAKLNVLGGNAALMSDPMSMLYNVYADPGQYAKNIASMVSGFGSFNKKSGETTFSIQEQMRMDAMASAMGMSREDFYNMARQSKKEQQIKKGFGKKFGKKTDFVTQNATWSQEKNGWVVKVEDDTKKEGFREVGLNELNGENDERLEHIFPEDKQDRLINLVKNIDDILSAKESQKGTDNHKNAVLADKSYNTLDTKNRELAKEGKEHFDNNIDFYMYGVEKTAKTMLETTQETNKAIEANKENIKKTFDVVNESNIKSYIQLTKDVFAEDGAYHGAWKAWAEGADHLQKLIEYLNTRLNNAKGNQKYQTNESHGKSVESVEKALKEGNAVNLVTSSISSAGTFAAPKDFIINPKTEQIIEPDEDDVIMGWKSGGPIDNALKNKDNNSLGNIQANSQITVNGTLKLDAGNQSIDIIEALRNDPKALRELVSQIFGQASSNNFGGKSLWMAHRNAM